MRAFVMTILVTIICSVAPSRQAHALDGQILWFREDSHNYGWSDVPDLTRRDHVPPTLTSPMSLAERCGRLVGRQMVRDRPGRIHSIQLEDVCIRNAGKI